MTKAAYPYPEDEFDQTALQPGPRGVHRQPRSRWSRWAPYLVILVVAPALAYGAITWLSNSGTNTSLPGWPSVSESSSADASTPAETPVETSTPTETPSVEATPAETPTPEPTVAFGTPVQVLNAAGVQGIAAGAAAKLTAAGFTDVTADNYGGAALDASTVFYESAEQLVTAQAVAAALGITPVEESAAQASSGVVVVLKSDYKP